MPAHHILPLRPGEQRVVAGVFPLHMLHGQLDGIAGGRDAEAIGIFNGNLTSAPGSTAGLGLDHPKGCPK